MAKAKGDSGGKGSGAKGDGKSKRADVVQQIAQNKKARHEFEIVQDFEAGIVLKGSEVKAIRAGGINLRESYVRFINSELFLVGAHINPYSQSSVDSHQAIADRKLLLHRKEIDRLSIQVSQKGMTIVALKVYFRDGKCKVSIGVGRGKKLFDKRESIKEREVERKLRRVLKTN